MTFSALPAWLCNLIGCAWAGPHDGTPDFCTRCGAVDVGDEEEWLDWTDEHEDAAT